MDPASYIAATGLKANYRALDIITNNLANVNSPGFKRDTPFFRLLLEESGKLSGSALAGTYTDFTPGALKQTNNPLDLGINGEGFFTVRTPAGIRYTRSGSFGISNGSELQTQNGFPVLDNTGQNIAIAFDPQGKNQILINPNGEITVDDIVSGTLNIVTFQDLSALRKEGNQLFISDQPPQPVVNPNVEQGFIEQSNSNAISAMLELIQIQRAYEFNLRTVNTIMNKINRSAIANIASQ